MPLFQGYGSGGLLGGLSAGLDPRMLQMARAQALIQMGAPLMSLQAAQDPGRALGQGLTAGLQSYQQQLMMMQEQERQRRFDEMRQQQFEMMQKRHQLAIEAAQKGEAQEESLRNMLSGQIAAGRLSPEADFDNPLYNMTETLMQTNPELAAKVFGQARMGEYQEQRIRAEEAENVAAQVDRVREADPSAIRFFEGADSPEDMALGWQLYSAYQTREQRALLASVKDEQEALRRRNAAFGESRKLLDDWAVPVPLRDPETDEIIPGEFTVEYHYPGDEKAGLPSEVIKGPDIISRIQDLRDYASLEGMRRQDPQAYEVELRDILQDARQEAIKKTEEKMESLRQGYAGGKYMPGGGLIPSRDIPQSGATESLGSGIRTAGQLLSPRRVIEDASGAIDYFTPEGRENIRQRGIEAAESAGPNGVKVVAGTVLVLLPNGTWEAMPFLKPSDIAHLL